MRQSILRVAGDGAVKVEESLGRISFCAIRCGEIETSFQVRRLDCQGACEIGDGVFVMLAINFELTPRDERSDASGMMPASIVEQPPRFGVVEYLAIGVGKPEFGVFAAWDKDESLPVGFDRFIPLLASGGLVGVMKHGRRVRRGTLRRRPSRYKEQQKRDEANPKRTVRQAPKQHAEIIGDSSGGSRRAWAFLLDTAAARNYKRVLPDLTTQPAANAAATPAN